MPKSPKVASLDAGLLARKGAAAPSDTPKPAPSSPSSVPHGTKETVAVTVRLDPERYHRMLAYGGQFTPRRTNQEILVSALDAFLEQQ